MKNLVVVRPDLRLTCALLKPRLRPASLHGATAQDGRGHALEQGCLMQLDERVRVLPVPARCVPTIDKGDMHIRVVDQRVREGHAHRPRAHNQVIRL
jgi:hypothetical protein